MPGACPLLSRQPKRHAKHVNCHARGKKPPVVEKYCMQKYCMFWGVPQNDLQTFLSLLSEPHRGIVEPLEIDRHGFGSQCGELSHPCSPALGTLSPLGSQYLDLSSPRACVHSQQIEGVSELQGHLFIMVSQSGRANLASFFRTCQTLGSLNTKKPSCQRRPSPRSPLHSP